MTSDRSSSGTPRLRGALIGCGFFAGNHMHAWHALDGAEIVAVCDLEGEKAQAMASRFGIADVYTDAASMLEALELDFVDIATTVDSHRPLVEQAVEHVATVICQKPFAERLADARAMVEQAEAAGCQLVIHENFRWQKPFRVLAERLQAGAIGTPHFARFSFRHGYDNYVNQPYLAEIERFTIMDLGLHLFDLARWFCGEVETLACTTQRLNPDVRGEDAFTALLRHAGGATSICDCSFRSILRPEPFPRTLATLEGDRGTLVLDREGRVVEHDEDGIRTLPAEPEVPAWGEQPWHVVQDSVHRFQQHAIEVMSGRARPAPSGADNLHTLALALAAYESAERRRTVAMADWNES